MKFVTVIMYQCHVYLLIAVLLHNVPDLQLEWGVWKVEVAAVGHILRVDSLLYYLIQDLATNLSGYSNTDREIPQGLERIGYSQTNFR